MYFFRPRVSIPLSARQDPLPPRPGALPPCRGCSWWWWWRRSGLTDGDGADERERASAAGEPTVQFNGVSSSQRPQRSTDDTLYKATRRADAEEGGEGGGGAGQPAASLTDNVYVDDDNAAKREKRPVR